MGVDEKFNMVLEQYSLEIRQMFKFGGALYLETEQGFFMLRQRPLKEGRAIFEEKIKAVVVENGFENVDCAVKNKEDKYVSEGNYGETYILRKWYQGDECELTNRDSVLKTAETLGWLHRTMWNIETEGVPYIAQTVAEKFNRRTGEMRRIITYLRKQKQKNEFESWMEKQLPVYVEQAYGAAEYLNKDYDVSLLRDAVTGGGVFHGALTGHNVIINEDMTAIVNFDRAKIGPKVHDLYHFMRKCGEKNSWDISLMDDIMEGYCRANLLDDRERNVLYAQLIYPEKFWKTVNMYYNGKKTWVPGKVEEKLTAVCGMQEQKEEFLRHLLV
ncbi:MAG: hypothetical protein ACI39R_01230 [Lachnospiraceae bacterium]